MKKLVLSYEGKITWCPIAEGRDGQEMFDTEFGVDGDHEFVAIEDITQEDLEEK